MTAPQGGPQVGLIMGSDSDWPTMEGAAEALAEFGLRDIDLTRIESRPTRTEFGTYWFHVDCIGHIDDAAVAEALGALHRKMALRFLGSWPVAAGTGRRPPSLDEQTEWLARLRDGKGD